MAIACERFGPDLAVGVLTLVPLILITSALGVGILRRWSDKLADYDAMVRAEQTRWNRRGARCFALLVGFGMGGAALTAIVLALVELTWRTNWPDYGIFGCSVAVTAGLGTAILGNINRALRFGQFPVTDAAPPEPSTSGSGNAYRRLHARP